MWKFESDSTLADALSGNLGQWPEDIEEIMLGKVDESQPIDKREASVSFERAGGGVRERRANTAWWGGRRDVPGR